MSEQAQTATQASPTPALPAGHLWERDMIIESLMDTREFECWYCPRCDGSVTIERRNGQRLVECEVTCG